MNENAGIQIIILLASAVGFLTFWIVVDTRRYLQTLSSKLHKHCENNTLHCSPEKMKSQQGKGR